MEIDDIVSKVRSRYTGNMGVRKQTIRKYELMMIIKPLLPDNVRKNVQEKIGSLISKAGGKIVSKDVWGKRYLAYPISRHTEGYYTIYQLEVPTDKISGIKREFGLINEIIRYLFIIN